MKGTIVDFRPGPVVTLYELEPEPGIRSARVIGLADDVARSLSVTAVRIATVPGRNVIGIEVPNARRDTVYLSEILSSEEVRKHSGRLPIALGKNIGGHSVVSDLTRMPASDDRGDHRVRQVGRCQRDDLVAKVAGRRRTNAG